MSKKLSEIASAPSVDVNTNFVGVRNVTGVFTDFIYSIAQLATYLKTLIKPGGTSGMIQYNDGAGGFAGNLDMNYSGGTFMLASGGVPNLLSDVNGITFQNKVNIQTTANQAMGQATFSTGTVTVGNTLVTANSEIIAWYAKGGLSTSGAMSVFYIQLITPGVSFVLQARNAATALVNNLDNSTVNYLIIN